MEQTLEFGTAAFFVALLQIIWVNILLSGDNSIAIALACRNLPDHQRKKGIFWGVGAAVILRIILTAFAVALLRISFIKLIGGVLLLYIGVQLVLPQADEGHEIDGKDRLFDAIKTIVIADFAMSLDNVLGVASAAKGHMGLLVLGLVMSIPLVVWGAKVVMSLMERFPWIVIAGGGLLGYLAGEMIQTDPALTTIWDGYGLHGHVLAWVGAILVIAIGKFLTWRMSNKPDPA